MFGTRHACFPCSIFLAKLTLQHPTCFVHESTYLIHPLQEAEGTFMVAFSSADVAVEWCLMVQQVLRDMSWPDR